MTHVVNIRKESYDVYIGRRMGIGIFHWGNPFVIGPDGTRSEVIEKYRQWIKTQPEMLKRLPELKGKVLGCYCKPLACHGDVLVEMINELGDDNATTT